MFLACVEIMGNLRYLVTYEYDDPMHNSRKKYLFLYPITLAV